MLVAVTQETEQLHFNNSQFFTFVAVSCPPTFQNCVMPGPTLLPPLTHIIYIPTGNLCAICSDRRRHLLEYYLGLCYAELSFHHLSI